MSNRRERDAPERHRLSVSTTTTASTTQPPPTKRAFESYIGLLIYNSIPFALGWKIDMVVRVVGVHGGSFVRRRRRVRFAAAAAA